MRHLRRTVTDGTIPLRTVPLFGLFLSRSRAVTALALSVDRALSLVHPIAAMDVTLVIYELCSPPGEIGLTVVVALIIWVAARNGRSALTFGVVVARTDCAATLRKCWLIARVHPPLRLPTPFSQATGCVVPERLRRIRRVDRDGPRVPHPPQRAWRTIVVACRVAGTILVAVAVIDLGECTLLLAVWNPFVIPRTHRSPVAMLGR